MPDRINRSFRNRRFWLTIGLALLAFAVYYPFSPAGRQASDAHVLRALEQRIPAQLASDPAIASPEGGLTSHPHLHLFYSERELTDAQWEKVVQIISRERAAFENLPPVSVSQFGLITHGKTRRQDWNPEP